MEEFTEQELQYIEDQKFMHELSDFVDTLPKANKDQLVAYNNKMNFMENIHREIRQKHPSFMPEYVSEVNDTEHNASNKYLDYVYNFRSTGGGTKYNE